MRFAGLVTPCYIINDEEYTQNITRFKAEFESRWKGRVLFGYSVKTNNFPYMLKAALAHGFYAEVVSPDEYAFALRCGCREDNIIYNGPQKRDTVVSACAAGSIVNLDNLEEVERVCAAFRDSEHKSAVGLRVNYDIERDCPGETTCTGIPGRFGICLESGDFEKALAMLRESGIELAGLHLHQSSKTRSLAIYRSGMLTSAAASSAGASSPESPRMPSTPRPCAAHCVSFTLPRKPRSSSSRARLSSQRRWIISRASSTSARSGDTGS